MKYIPISRDDIRRIFEIHIPSPLYRNVARSLRYILRDVLTR